MCRTLYIVLPCYNEEEVLPESIKLVIGKLDSLISYNKVSPKSRAIFVDDGSKDKTWQLICQFHSENPLIGGIKLAHNRGHQNAVLAGLMYSKQYADVTISIDADLQQDIKAIDEFLEKYHNGCDIVYGVRNSRDTDSVFKKSTALFFYKMMQGFGCEIIQNHADYRLMSKKALEALAQYKEVNLFLRGMVPLLGFQSDIVYFDVFPRTAGKSKYPLKKMVSFAMDGITSLSVFPIRLITATGFTVFLLSLILLIYFLVSFFTGKIVSGWAAPLVSVWAIGGLLLISVGIVGEYIGKTYFETKGRPRFIIEEVQNDTKHKDE